MQKTTVTAVLISTLLVGACVDNNESFYVEHMKVTPDYPECVTSSGDNTASGLSVDVSRAISAGSYFYVTNAIMVKEEYELLKAESNGILIEGYDVYFILPGGGLFGGTEYFTANEFLEPESSDVVFGNILTSTALANMRAEYGCPYLMDSSNLLAIRDHVLDKNQGAVDEMMGQGVPLHFYAVIRFLGTTQGGLDVETQEFTVSLYTSCGPVGGWGKCVANLCYAFCNPLAQGQEVCNPGINDPVDCSDILDGLGPSDDAGVGFCSANNC